MKISTKWLLTLGAVACAVLLAGRSVQADNAVHIDLNIPSGTLGVTFDGSGDGGNNQAIVTAILSQPTTVGARTYTTWAYTAADASGSMEIYDNSSTHLYTPTVGDQISVKGLWSPFHALPELAAPFVNYGSTLIASGQTVPPVPSITISAPAGILGNPNDTPLGNANHPTGAGVGPLSEGGDPRYPNNNGFGDQQIEGYYAEIQNVWINPWYGGGLLFPQTNVSYYMTDQENETLTLFFYYTSYSTCGAMVGTAVPQGTVDVYGFASAYPNTVKSGTIITTNWADEFIPTAIVQVPEPSSFMLAGVGLLSLFTLIRRRRS